MVQMLGIGALSRLVGVHLSLLLLGLLGSLGHFALASFPLLHTLNDSYGNSLPHVTHGETSKGSVV